jgi:hypothetical protein
VSKLAKFKIGDKVVTKHGIGIIKKIYEGVEFYVKNGEMNVRTIPSVYVEIGSEMHAFRQEDVKRVSGWYETFC